MSKYTETRRWSAGLPHTIKNFRKQAKLTQEALGKAMGVSRDTIARLETGSQRLTVDQLFAIAGACDVSPQQILSQIADPATVGEKPEIKFHLRAEHGRYLGAIDREKFVPWYERYAQLHDRLFGQIPADIPQFQITMDSRREAELIAEEIAVRARAYWNLGTRPLKDVAGFVESLGLLLGGTAFDNEKLFAVMGRRPGDNTVGILVNIDPGIVIERQRFSIIHELGHLLAHDEEFTTQPDHVGRGDGKNLKEIFADRFAEAFLVPREELRKQLSLVPFRADDPQRSLRYLKKYFGVSNQVILYSLLHTGVLTKPRFRDLMDQEEAKRNFKQETRSLDLGLEDYHLKTALRSGAIDKDTLRAMGYGRKTQEKGNQVAEINGH